MKDYIEERAMNIANYIIENNATVRQTAKEFGISKSTVHMVVNRTVCVENKIENYQSIREMEASLMLFIYPLEDVISVVIVQIS